MRKSLKIILLLLVNLVLINIVNATDASKITILSKERVNYYIENGRSILGGYSTITECNNFRNEYQKLYGQGSNRTNECFQKEEDKKFYYFVCFETGSDCSVSAVNSADNSTRTTLGTNSNANEISNKDQLDKFLASLRKLGEQENRESLKKVIIKLNKKLPDGKKINTYKGVLDYYLSAFNKILDEYSDMEDLKNTIDYLRKGVSKIKSDFVVCVLIDECEDIAIDNSDTLEIKYLNLVHLGGIELCNKQIFDKFGSQKYICTIGGGCTANTQPATSTIPSASPNVAGACIPLNEWNNAINTNTGGICGTAHKKYITYLPENVEACASGSTLTGSIVYNKSDRIFSWKCNKGDKIESCYTETGYEKMYDNKEEYMFFSTKSNTGLTWSGANEACQNMNIGGYSDWRLPNNSELNLLLSNRGIYDVWSSQISESGSGYILNASGSMIETNKNNINNYVCSSSGTLIMVGNINTTPLCGTANNDYITKLPKDLETCASGATLTGSIVYSSNKTTIDWKCTNGSELENCSTAVGHYKLSNNRFIAKNSVSKIWVDWDTAKKSCESMTGFRLPNSWELIFIKNKIKLSGDQTEKTLSVSMWSGIEVGNQVEDSYAIIGSTIFNTKKTTKIGYVCIKSPLNNEYVEQVSCGTAHNSNISKYPTGKEACEEGTLKQDQISNSGGIISWFCKDDVNSNDYFRTYLRCSATWNGTINLCTQDLKLCSDGTKVGRTGQNCEFVCPIVNKIDGVCNDDINGKTLSSKPTTNLCTSGTATTVTGEGPWTWTCSGSNGGANINCSANKIIPDYLTITSSGQIYMTTPWGCTNSEKPTCSGGIDTLMKNWNDAMNYCSNMSYGGYDDWFLPNKEELMKLREIWISSFNKQNHGLSMGYYWSSTEMNSYNHNKTYVLDIYNTAIRYSVKSKAEVSYVHCIRKVVNETTNVHFDVQVSKSKINIGEKLDIIIKVLDKNNNIAKDYVGKILIFSESDPKAQFLGTLSEGIYNFKVSDAGVIKFENAVKFSKTGIQDINVYDMSNDSIFGYVEIEVLDQGNKINGVCNVDINGKTLSSKPTTNLCTSGTATTINGEGPWTWTCNGSNGGTPANCSVNKEAVLEKINGVCNADINGKSLSSKPTTNLCTSGTATTINGEGPWTWTCNGSNGGTPANCSVDKGNLVKREGDLPNGAPMIMINGKWEYLMASTPAGNEWCRLKNPNSSNSQLGNHTYYQSSKDSIRAEFNSSWSIVDSGRKMACIRCSYEYGESLEKPCPCENNIGTGCSTN